MIFVKSSTIVSERIESALQNSFSRRYRERVEVAEH